MLQVFPFIGAFAARTVASVVDVTIAGAQRVLFYDRKERFSPPLDPDFATYSQPKKRRMIPNSIAFSLLLFGLGIISALIFIIVWAITRM